MPFLLQMRVQFGENKLYTILKSGPIWSVSLFFGNKIRFLEGVLLFFLFCPKVSQLYPWKTQWREIEQDTMVLSFLSELYLKIQFCVLSSCSRVCVVIHSIHDKKLMYLRVIISLWILAGLQHSAKMYILLACEKGEGEYLVAGRRPSSLQDLYSVLSRKQSDEGRSQR